MIHELAVVNRPVSAWFCLLVFGGPVALLSLAWWMGKLGWIKLAGHDNADEYRRESGGATSILAVGMPDDDGSLYAMSEFNSFCDYGGINPATGLMMVGYTDTGGNLYGSGSSGSFSDD